MKRESLILRFLYRTILGRMLLKLLTRPKISELVGRLLSTRVSKELVPFYIRKHRIDMSDIEIPQGGFSSFNEFFIRKRNAECIDITYEHLISPCDGLLSIVDIQGNTVLNIKNTEYMLDNLLGSRELAKRFKGGKALVFRLTPAHYHRYCYAAEGRVILQRRIKGRLHCVRPIALQSVPVFVQNSREYQILETEYFGTVIQMEIGALMVGRIRNDQGILHCGYVKKGDEKGYFEYGGSTIIMLFMHNKIYLNENLYQRQNRDGEIPVRMGEFIATADRRKKIWE